MAQVSKLFKVFTAFKGLDLRSSDILRSNEAATAMNNMTFRQTGAMSKRKGFQAKDQTGNGGGYGMTTFNNINTTTGAVTEEVISIDDNLQRLATYSFTVTYNGHNSGVYYDLYLHTDGKFYFDVYDNYARILNKDLGNGYETSGRVTISDLTTSIDAASSSTSATVNGTQASVTTINVDSGHNIAVNDVATIPISGGGTVNKTITSRTATSITFSGAISVDDDAAITATGTHFSCGAISGGSTNSAAFIPVADSVAISGSGTAITFEAWLDISTPGTYTTPFSTFYSKRTNAEFENATFAQLNNVLYIATGHDVLHKYDGQRVYKAGLPQATTPTAASAGADAGSFPNNRILRYKIVTQHTDDKGNVHESEISDHVVITASGTGESVNVTYTELAGSSGYDTDGTLKYLIYRTDDSADATDSSLYYLVHTADHGDTIPWKDTGATEGAEFIEPIKTAGLPPTDIRYIDVWRGQLIGAGSISATDTVYYSNVVTSDGWATATDNFIVDNKVTGLKALDNILYIFKKHSIDGVTGDLSVDNIQVDRVSREGVGCAAHNTIQEVRGRLFFLSDQGVYSISPEGVQDVGSPIYPKFQAGNNFSFRYATAFNWLADNKYILFMPNLATVNDPSLSNITNDEVYVYDYFRDAWLEWSSLSFMGGMTEANDDIYFSRRLSNNVDICKMLQTTTKQDYNDHHEAITFSYSTNWMTLDEPSIWKKFLRCKIHSYDTSVNDFENDAFTVTLKSQHDYNTGKDWTNLSYDFSGGSQGWGLGPWGQFPWGEIRLPQLKKKIASKKVRSMRLIFENSTIDQNVLISGFELEVVTPYKPTMKE
jgi:hypothetical protein